MDDLILHLHRGGIRTALVTTAIDASDDGSLHEGHELVWAVRTSRPGRYSRIWWQVTGKPGAWDAWKPDLVLSIGDAGGAMALRRTCPSVTHAHGTATSEAKSALTDLSLRGVARTVVNLARLPSRLRFFRAFTAVWAAGPAIADQVQAWPYRVPSSKISMVPNTVDVSQIDFDEQTREQIRAKLGLEPGQLAFVSAGRLDRQKGIDLATKAVLNMSGALPPKLFIAGTGTQESELRRLTIAHPNGSQVQLMGLVPRAQLFQLLIASDALLFPTRRVEGFPMIALEAAATGLPIITTKRANLPPSLTDSPAVHIVDADTAAITETLARFAPLSNRQPYLPPEYQALNAPRLVSSLVQNLLFQEARSA